MYYVPLGPDIPYQAIVDTRSNTCKRHYCNFEPTNKKRQYGSEKYLFFFIKVVKDLEENNAFRNETSKISMPTVRQGTIKVDKYSK